MSEDAHETIDIPPFSEMTSPVVAFTVAGVPKGQPRPQAFVMRGRARVYDPGTAAEWKWLVASAAKSLAPFKPWEGPVKVSMILRFPRPKSHFNSKGLLKPQLAGACQGSKPDAENCAKAILDALNGLGFWKDDAQVSTLIVHKQYTCDAPHSEIAMQPIEESHHQLEFVKQT